MWNQTSTWGYVQPTDKLEIEVRTHELSLSPLRSKHDLGARRGCELVCVQVCPALLMSCALYLLVTVQLWDEEMLFKDKIIGTCSVPLAEVCAVQRSDTKAAMRDGAQCPCAHGVPTVGMHPCPCVQGGMRV